MEKELALNSPPKGKSTKICYLKLGIHLYADAKSLMTYRTHIIPLQHSFLTSQRIAKFKIIHFWKGDVEEKINSIPFCIEGKLQQEMPIGKQKTAEVQWNWIQIVTYHSYNRRHLTSFEGWIKHPLHRKIAIEKINQGLDKKKLTNDNTYSDISPQHRMHGPIDHCLIF